MGLDNTLEQEKAWRARAKKDGGFNSFIEVYNPNGNNEEVILETELGIYSYDKNGNEIKKI